MKKLAAKEIKIGIAFIVMLFVLYFGISYLKGINIFKPANTYNVLFEDVSDLTPSSPVFLNGYQVGLVQSMQLDKKHQGMVLAILSLNKDVELSKDCQVKIVAAPLGGAKIIIDRDYTEIRKCLPTDTIIGIRNKGMMESLSDSKTQISNIVSRLDSVVMGVQLIVSNPNLNGSINNIGDITKQLDYSTKELNSLLTSLNKDVPKITAGLTSTSSNLSQISGKVNAMDLEASYKSIDATLKNIEKISESVNSKNNSLGLLLNDRQLYDSITSTLNNATLLLKDVRENPNRYINVKVF